MAFRARKMSGGFEKRAPELVFIICDQTRVVGSDSISLKTIRSIELNLFMFDSMFNQSRVSVTFSPVVMETQIFFKQPVLNASDPR